MKIAVIGGGSVYTPELVEGLIAHYPELPVEELCLMDIAPERLRIVGGLAKRMVQAAGVPIEVKMVTEIAQALDEADYVILQIRVGGTAARILDEKIPLDFGVIGQETTGPGGFALALRTIPVALTLAHAMENLCPRAFLINFANPSGLVTEALLRYTRVRAIGLCNVPFGMRNMIAQWLKASPEQLQLDYFGLNHLSWVRGVTLEGQDVFDHVFTHALEQARQGAYPFASDLLEALGLLPSYYLRYYYRRDEVLAEQRRAGRTRAEEVQEIERELLDSMPILGLPGSPRSWKSAGGLLLWLQWPCYALFTTTKGKFTS
ncbi:MAG: hypothetical protein ABDI20_06235 [Candidatus Bipolaricaulaceae bacterium]